MSIKKMADLLEELEEKPASKIGARIVRIDERDLEEYLSARRVAPIKKAAEPPVRPCRYVPGMKVV